MNKTLSSRLFDPGIFVTMTLIVLNGGVFAGLSLSGEITPASLHRFGAQFGPSIWQGEYWRFLTTLFLHYNLLHLVFNLYALYVLGWMVEPLLGRRRFFSIYIFSGIFGSILSVSVHPDFISVGASGAIFGLAGAALAMRLFQSPSLKKTLFDPFGFFLLLFIFFNLIMGFLQESVDNAAHLGGLLAGFILGFYYMARIRDDAGKLLLARIAYLLFSALFLLALFYGLRPFRSSGWQLWYAQQLRYMGRIEPAEKSYRQAVRLKPKNPLYHKELGSFLMRKGNPGEALEQYRAALDLKGEEGELSFLCGVAKLALGEFDQAYEYYRKACDKGYFNQRALSLLGSFYFLKAERDKALDAYIRAIRMSSHNPLGYQALLFLLTTPSAWQNPKDLDFILQETRNGRSPDSLRFLFLANYYRHFRSFKEALEQYKIAEDKFQQQYLYHYDIAWCLFQMGKIEDAERAVNMFLAHLPDMDFPGLAAHKNIPLMLKLRILKARGDKEKALRIRDTIEQNYRKEIKREKNTIYTNDLAYHLSEENYKIQEAVALAKEAVENNPRPYTLDTLAWCYYRAGEFDKALENLDLALKKWQEERLLRTALNILEDDPIILKPDSESRMYHYHRAAVLSAMGQKEQALKSLDLSLQNSADFEDFSSALTLQKQLSSTDK